MAGTCHNRFFSTFKTARNSEADPSTMKSFGLLVSALDRTKRAGNVALRLVR
jgi:hypothetical protein